MPIPVGENGGEDGFEFGGRLADFGFEAGDFLLGFVAFDVALEGDFARDGFGRFGVGLFGGGGGDDGFEGVDGALGEALLHGVIDLFPLRIARGGGERGGHD